MELRHKLRPTRHPWTETEDSLLYYWMEHDKVNHLSAKAIGEEMAKEVEFLRSLKDPSLSLPIQARKYTADAIKNRVNKMKESKSFFRSLTPRNPTRQIAKNEANRNGLGFTNVSFSTPLRPTIPDKYGYAALIQETPPGVAHSWLFPPERQVHPHGNIVGQRAEDFPDFYEKQEDVSSPRSVVEPQNGGSSTQYFDDNEPDLILPGKMGKPQHKEDPTQDFNEKNDETEYDEWRALAPIRFFLGYPASMVIPNPHLYPATNLVAEANHISPEKITIENTLRRAQVNHEWGMPLEQAGWQVPLQKPSP